MLEKIIQDLYNLNNFTSKDVNSFKDKKHEIVVQEIFIQNNLIETTDNSIITLLKSKSNKNLFVEDLKNQNVFISQPFGSQNPPDFIICVNGFVLWVECKSGIEKITWNAGYPSKDTLYVFSCKVLNTTTIFFGQFTEILIKNPNFEKDYQDFDDELKQIAKRIFKERYDTKSFDFYMRRMLVDKTKYSSPEIRKNLFELSYNYLFDKNEL